MNIEINRVVKGLKKISLILRSQSSRVKEESINDMFISLSVYLSGKGIKNFWMGIGRWFGQVGQELGYFPFGCEQLLRRQCYEMKLFLIISF